MLGVSQVNLDSKPDHDPVSTCPGGKLTAEAHFWPIQQQGI